MAAVKPPPPSAPAAQPFRWLGPVLLVAAVIAVYANTLTAPFLFDDAGAVLNNPTIRRLASAAIFQPPADGSTTTGRPLVNASLAVNYAISGIQPWSYHALNLLLHAASALALFGIVRRAAVSPFLRRDWKPASPSQGRAIPSADGVAFAVALLWAVHPLNTESVACVAQRTEVLGGLFYFLTLFAFTRAVERVPDGRRWLAASVAFAFLGVASKEIVVTAPLVVVLYDRTFVSGSFAEGWRRHGRYYLVLVSSWLLLAVLLAGGGGSRGVSAGFGLGVSSWSYLLKQAEALVLYLKLAVWPHPLVLDYGTAVTASLADVAWQSALIVLLLAGVVWALVRRPVIGFLGAWFFIILSPSSSVVPLVAQTMAEHRMYLPLAALVALAAAGVRQLFGVRSAALIGIAAVTALCALTVVRNRVFGDELLVWQANVAASPLAARGHNNFARVLQQRGRTEEANAEYAQALRLQPEYVSAHYNWGSLLLQQGNYEAAVRQLGEAVRLAPGFVDARVNLGTAWLRAGRTDEAITELQRAVELQPDAVDARYNLAMALEVKGRGEEAAALFRQVADEAPALADAQFRAARAAAKQGQAAEAMRRYEEVLRVQPNHAGAHAGLGLLLARQERLPDAARHLEQAVQLDPADADAHANLGNVYLMTGDATRAIREYEATLRLRPGDARVQANLQVARDALAGAGR